MKTLSFPVDFIRNRVKLDLGLSAPPPRNEERLAGQGAGNSARSRLLAGSGRLTGGCGHDWPPHAAKVIATRTRAH